MNAAQPIETANHPQAHLRLATVMALTGRGRSTIYAMVKAKTFPEPIRHGARCTRWVARDVTSWLESAK